MQSLKQLFGNAIGYKILLRRKILRLRTNIVYGVTLIAISPIIVSVSEPLATFF
jgi:hypothetical protein